MEIVIKINDTPKNDHERWVLEHGTPLPKGHGDLMDKNELIKRYEKDCGRRIYVDNFIHDIELNMQTIIEADRAERSDKE